MTQSITRPPYSMKQLETIAEAFANSKLFGIQNKDQALSLMMICHAEGLHPAIAARDYHIIQGKPALKSDAMLARFQQAGGTIQWKDLSNDKVTAAFSHPAGGTVTITWTLDDARKAGFVNKDNWRKFPRQMLRARVVSEGIRTVYPGIVVGRYTPEEVRDFDPYDDTDPEALKTLKARHTEIINHLNGLCDLESFETYLSEITHEMDVMPPNMLETLDDVINSRRQQIETTQAKPLAVRFSSVQQALDWARQAKEEFQGFNTLGDMQDWLTHNQRYVDALSILNADKYTENGMPFQQRVREAIQNKIDELSSEEQSQDP